MDGFDFNSGPTIVRWLGIYCSAHHALGISDYDGMSLRFAIEGAVKSGVASVDPGNPCTAQYEEMVFAFGGDDSIIITGALTRRPTFAHKTKNKQRISDVKGAVFRCEGDGFPPVLPLPAKAAMSISICKSRAGKGTAEPRRLRRQRHAGMRRRRL